MNSKEFKTILTGSTDDYLLLDIREAEELTPESFIASTVHMPMGKVFTEAGKDNLPKDKKIIVFCRTGARAAVVARELTERGYTIDGLEGGLEAYSANKSVAQ